MTNTTNEAEVSAVDMRAERDEARAENQQLRSLLERVGAALETMLLDWDGTIADPKLADAYQGFKAYREWRRHRA